jgi:hypothetical protein
MGVSDKAIRKLLRRSGWIEPAPIQPELALVSLQPGTQTCPLLLSSPRQLH